MDSLFVGVCHVHVFVRHAGGLKDKRRIFKSIKQRLRNRGFSVTELPSENPKHGSIGFSFAGADHGAVQKMIEEGLQLFMGLEIISDQDVFDYSYEQKEQPFESERFPEGE